MRLVHHRALAARRGFTLAELLAVVAMIGTLAAVAAPGFVQLLRDQRVQRSAKNLAEFYRVARSQAVARGVASLVHWDKGGGWTSGKGQLEIREAVLPGNDWPSQSCLTTNWANGANTNRLISRIEPEFGLYELATVDAFDPANNAVNQLDVCFTPRGRTFFSVNNGPLVVLNGVPRLVVKNSRSGYLRTLFIPPNGVARLEL